jgi:hypothetical protein
MTHLCNRMTHMCNRMTHMCNRMTHSCNRGLGRPVELGLLQRAALTSTNADSRRAITKARVREAIPCPCVTPEFYSVRSSRRRRTALSPIPDGYGYRTSVDRKAR